MSTARLVADIRRFRASLGCPLDHALEVDRPQVAHRGSVYELTSRLVAGPVAGAIPGTLGGVPGDQAALVGAVGAERMQSAFIVGVEGHMLSRRLDYAPFAAPEA